MIERIGDGYLHLANEANIPINIYIENPNGNPDGIYKLTADNYMPRRGTISSGHYEYHSTDKNELLILIKTHIIPLYETALKQLNKIVNSEVDMLYYRELTK